MALYSKEPKVSEPLAEKVIDAPGRNVAPSNIPLAKPTLLKVTLLLPAAMVPLFETFINVGILYVLLPLPKFVIAPPYPSEMTTISTISDDIEGFTVCVFVLKLAID